MKQSLRYNSLKTISTEISSKRRMYALVNMVKVRDVRKIEAVCGRARARVEGERVKDCAQVMWRKKRDLTLQYLRHAYGF